MLTRLFGAHRQTHHHSSTAEALARELDSELDRHERELEALEQAPVSHERRATDHPYRPMRRASDFW